jgi:hypothetical protein
MLFPGQRDEEFQLVDHESVSIMKEGSLSLLDANDLRLSYWP